MPVIPRIRGALVNVGVLALLVVATFAVADALAGKRPAPAFTVKGMTIPPLTNVRPGATWTTKVTIVVGKKRVRPALTVTAVKRSERPGLGGGYVLRELRVAITDLKTKRVVYAGKLVGMNRRPLGAALPARTSRAFQLVISLRDGGVPAVPGTGDDAYQGSRGRLAWSWTTAR